MAELEAIVADYLEQAALWDAIPAAGPCSLLAELRGGRAMSERHDPDPVERAELTEQDLAIATLVGRYIERREAGQPPRVHDLLAVAAEFGDAAVDALRTVLACYEAMRASERRHAGTLGGAAMSAPADSSPTVTEVVRFEDLPLGSRGTRRAIARWSDGSESEALSWYADEILICEGDLIGKTREQLRSLHFRRDRDWLQS